MANLRKTFFPIIYFGKLINDKYIPRKTFFPN